MKCSIYKESHAKKHSAAALSQVQQTAKYIKDTHDTVPGICVMKYKDI